MMMASASASAPLPLTLTELPPVLLVEILEFLSTREIMRAYLAFGASSPGAREACDSAVLWAPPGGGRAPLWASAPWLPSVVCMCGEVGIFVTWGRMVQNPLATEGSSRA